MIPKGYSAATGSNYPFITRLEGREIYPAGPGVPSLPDCLVSAEICGEIWIFAKCYGALSVLVNVKRFETAEDFLGYCSSEGSLSKEEPSIRRGRF